MSSSRISILALDRWSAMSFATTAHMPVHGEPSLVRPRAAGSALGCCMIHLHPLEIPRVDLIQIGHFDVEGLQLPARLYGSLGGLRAHIGGRLQHVLRRRVTTDLHDLRD